MTESMSSLDRWMERLTGWSDRLLPFRRFRPLDRIPSLKLKLSIVIVSGVAVTLATSTVAFWLGLRARYGVAAAVVLSLAMVQILARGITAPLRDMAEATASYSTGDYSRRIEASGTDEVAELAASFNRMAGDIAELEQQRRDLMANVSHELRTPIAVLQGNLENMIDGVEAASPATIEAMHRQTVRLGGLVRQLLDLSRLEAGESPVDREPVDVVGINHHVVQEAELRTPQPKLEVDLPQSLRVLGDAERLHQVLANLVDNAIVHGPDDEPITVAAGQRADRAWISVTDRGPGVPEARLDHIFDRYVGSSSAPSTGLGLAIAKSIVDRHDGTITARNTAPGLSVEVRLPLA